ncbi:hypothetical protein RHSIM_RhsimUnG0023100 [Rhododendron simsii]|uniref:COMM domain-containing protein n=1 Tax=Rhododendron simsii TaxID=118357 RepID=A0A834FXU6_RHOSS|nr:hypothetical protein RHSIM_RhsimUnG0023100 [Rhododendron simsii]
MDGDTVLYLQLHKLSAIKSQEDLENLLTSLWKTRKTGLPPHLKSSLQSLLNLPSPGEVDPYGTMDHFGMLVQYGKLDKLEISSALVLACLRSVMRKCVHENFTDDDILKLFPPDLSLDLQSNLILLFQKYQNQWKEEMSGEQHLLPRTSISHQVNAGLLPSVGSFLSSETFASLWPRQDEPFNRFSRNDIGASTPLTAETNASHVISIPLQRDVGPTDNLEILPRLKSMTWTLENRKKTPTKRVAVISLKSYLLLFVFLTTAGPTPAFFDVGGADPYLFRPSLTSTSARLTVPTSSLPFPAIFDDTQCSFHCSDDTQPFSDDAKSRRRFAGPPTTSYTTCRQLDLLSASYGDCSTTYRCVLGFLGCQRLFFGSFSSEAGEMVDVGDPNAGLSSGAFLDVIFELQDYTNSPSGETEVKFQLTRDTLEAMLRSMTYISEQLSSLVGSSSGPLHKKQRQ